MSRRWLTRKWARRFFDRHHVAPRLRLELLEDRAVPAVHIFARGETLFIEGDRNANAVDLVRAGNEVRVTADGLRTQTFTGITSVLADLGAGHDRMTATVAPSAYSPYTQPLPFGLNANLGAGNDSFTANLIPPPPTWYLYRSGSIALGVEGAAGDDSVGVQVGDPQAPNSLLLDELSVALGGGSGDDVLDFTMQKVRAYHAEFFTNSGQGNDRVSQRISEVGFYDTSTPFSILTGDGDDDLMLAVRNSYIDGIAVDAGAGNDRVSAWLDEVGFTYSPAPFSVLTGDGDDDLTLAVQNTNFNGEFSADTGSGDDRFNAWLDEVGFSYSPAPFSVLTGEDDDALMLAVRGGNFDGGLILDTEAGNDAVFADLSEVEFGDEAGLPAIRSGTGHDSVAVAMQKVNFGKQGFVQDAGAGNDFVTLQLSDVTTEGADFRALTGDGHDVLMGTIGQFSGPPLGVLVDLGSGSNICFLTFEMNLPAQSEVPPDFVATANIAVLGGSGNDMVSVEVLVRAPLSGNGSLPGEYGPGARFRLNLLVDGGSGRDVLNVRGGYDPFLESAQLFYLGEVDVSVLGGADNDSLFVFWPSLPLVQFTGVAVGGAGADTALTSPNVTQVNIER